MNLVTLAGGHFRRNALSTTLNLLLLAFGVATVALIMLLGHQLDQRLQRDAENIDLVVGAKGSPLQIILSSIFHVDVPTGNISMTDARWVEEHPLVAGVIPLALGDSYQGLRIVGTNSRYLDHYDAQFAAGDIWPDNHGAVLGAEAARQTGLGIGDGFHGVHGITSQQAGAGFVHADHTYRVSGILEPTGSVLDRLILVSVESVWEVHDADGHWSRTGTDTPAERYLTALLVQYRSPLAAAMLPRLINSRDALQAASPAYETARLMQLVGVGMRTLQMVGWLLIGLAALGVFAVLYNAMRERQYDLAMMRVLGATRKRAVAQVLAEALGLATIGALLGLLLAHVGAELLAGLVSQAEAFRITGRLFLPQELLLMAAAWLLALGAALLPAWRVYRTDVADVLQRGAR